MAERIIGIDFGTSTSVIRVRRYQNGMPIDAIPSAVTFGNSAPMVPTLIQKQDNSPGAYYGYDAETPRKRTTVYQNFKLDLEDPDAATRERAKALTAEYLKECLGKAYLHQSAEGFLGAKDDKITTYVSYPVKWSEETCAFMVQAAKDAGFPNVEGLDEAQACIRAVTEQYVDVLKEKGYFCEGKPSTILLIDMGAGTTDLVLCRYTPGDKGETEVLSTWPKNGKALFGGHTIDDILYSYISESFPDVQAVRRLPLGTFKAWKESVVSPALQKDDSVDYFAALEPIGMALGEDMMFNPIDRKTFEALADDYLSVLPRMINDILKDAKIPGKELDLVILTGGHSQWYYVREMLMDRMPHFGRLGLDKIRKEPARIISLARPQETVALGLVYKGISLRTPTQDVSKGNEPVMEKLLHIERVEPDCNHQGNIEYWVRNSDKQIFLDEKGTLPIQYENTRLQNLGHEFGWVTVENKRIRTCKRCGIKTDVKDVIISNDTSSAAEEIDDNSPTPEEEFQLTNKEAGYEIAKYLGKRERVIIPSTIRGRKVVSIGANAFAPISRGVEIALDLTFYGGIIPRLVSNTSLSYVEIPASCTSIGDNAFSRCRNLRYIKLHSGIEKIGAAAFQFCPNLEIVDFGCGEIIPKVVMFPPDLKIIGSNAFLEDNLREVTLSKKTKTQNFLGNAPFGRCAVFYYEDQE